MSASRNIDLVSEIAALRANRERHVVAMAQIDGTLLKIAEVLGDAEVTRIRSPAADPSTASRPHKYRKLELTASDFILNLLERQGVATTLEINAAWRSERRGGSANNTIGRLVNDGLIVREALQG